MMIKRRIVETATGEEYLHKAVWQVVQRQLERARAQQPGFLLDDLVAMVFASHALEGYLNFLGERIAPTEWRDERERFAATGVTGKLTFLEFLCEVPPLTPGRRPHSTIVLLIRLRNRIAHPKTIKIQTETEYPEGKRPPLFHASYLEQQVSHAKALRAMEDVREVVARLHSAAAARYPCAELGKDGLEGVQSTRTTSGRIKDQDLEAGGNGVKLA
jgi:hypothetical protein